MKYHNGREDKPTRGVTMKGVVMAMSRIAGGTRYTRNRGK